LHRILLIAKRDYIASVRSKAFIFGLVVFPVLFGGSFIGIALMKAKPDLKDRRVAIVDRTGVAAAAVIQAAQAKNASDLFDKKTGKQAMPRYVFEAVEPYDRNPAVQRLALSDRVRRGDLFAFIEIGPDALHPGNNRNKDHDTARGQVAYYSNAGAIDEVQNWLAEVVNNGLRQMHLAQLGVSPSHFEDLIGDVKLRRMNLVSRDARTGQIQPARKRSDAETFVVPFTLTMLLAMIVMATSGPMLPSVAEDKLQRVFEMLLGCATPFELMAGKVLAAVGRSLTSSLFYSAGAVLVLQGLAMTGLAPFGLMPWFFVYLVADVTMLSGFAVALGAACGSPQESQSLGIVLLSPVMIPLFLIMPVIQRPNGALATILSLVPPFTPLLMLMRQALPGGPPAWQPWMGLAGIAAWAMAITWAAARIFRIAILAQGKAPKVAVLLRWAVRG
jgi:ABC-2 type transport system permease protein